MSENVERLKSFPALRGMSLQQVSALAEFGEEHTADKGKVIFQEGDQSEHLLFLLDGELEVRKKGGFLAKVEPLNLVGEMGALFNNPRSASVVAAKTSRYLLVSKENFDRLLESDGEIGYKFYKNLAKVLASHLRANNMLVEFYQVLH